MFLLQKVLLGTILITKLCNCEMENDTKVVFDDGQVPHFELGIVPYYVEKEQYGEDVLLKIQDVMREIESQSCLKFVQLLDQGVAERTTPRVLLITNKDGVRECVHDPGTFLSKVELPLGYDCLGRAQVLHTILHGVGMQDEVTHPGRDQYVRVMWANIAPEYRPLYQLAADYQPKTVEYDPRSVMQYHDRAYSVNGKPTLEPLISGLVIEPSENLSQLDILRLQLLYNAECTKRDVQDLLQTCKNTLQRAGQSPNKKKLEGQDGNGESSYEDQYADSNPNSAVDSNKGVNPGDTAGPNPNAIHDDSKAATDYDQAGNPDDATVGVPNVLADSPDDTGLSDDISVDDVTPDNPAAYYPDDNPVQLKLTNTLSGGDVSKSVSDYSASDDY